LAEHDAAIPYYTRMPSRVSYCRQPAGVSIRPLFSRTEQHPAQIADENRHSGTAFVVPRAEGDFDLCWFTAKVEDDLCGHANLGIRLRL
jgi:predicted PhzF superfamily epimerase YddE/YHI9